MKIKAFKYLLAFLIPLSVYFSFNSEGWLSFRTLIMAFGVIPLLELILKPNPENLNNTEKELLQKDRFYDWLLYLTVPIQYTFLIWYLSFIGDYTLSSTEFWGKTIALGILCGVLGINVAHELGHRRKKAEKLLSRILLFSTLYPHFFIEHNYGHHKNVATPDDPATARYNEAVYIFWFRSMWYSYLSAWKIENQRLIRSKKGGIWNNEMLWYTVIEIIMLLAVFLLFGSIALLGFILASLFGILMLETVNYIEHYGLLRKKISNKRYENTQAVHSWNSDHVLGRMMLFELTRHSDHHANPEKKYQVLSHYEESPQLPTGYPGMMLLALFPPIWFRVMNPRIER